MRKVLILAAALVLCAGPAGAQQGDAVAPGQAGTVRPAAGPTPAQVQAPVERAPSLFVSTEEIRSHVRQAEAARTGDEPSIESRDAWAILAAAALTALMVVVFTS